MAEFDIDKQAHHQTEDLLARLMIARKSSVSAITQRCLNALESPLETQSRHPDDSDMAVLQPLYPAILEIANARSSVPLTYNHGETYERLAKAILRIQAVEVSTTMLKPFMSALGIKCIAPEVEEEIETDTVTALDKEINIIWNEYNAFLDRWSYTFPEPSAENISWPLNFTEVRYDYAKSMWKVTNLLPPHLQKERATIRKLARNLVKEHPHLASKAVNPEELQEALQTLKDNWPISKGNVTAIVQLVLDEASREFTRSVSRSRSPQPKDKDVGGDEDDGNEDDDSDGEDEDDGAAGKVDSTDN